MKTRILVLAAVFGLALGCDPDEKPAQPPAPAPETPKADAPKPVEGKKTALNKTNTLFLETFPDGRKRVLIEAEICLREGSLELLMCRKGSKEHEAILAAPVDARLIHTALLAVGAKPGKTVQYEPKFAPPSGTTIKIWLQYKKKDEIITVDAKEWVRSTKTQKALDVDWVFAGSQFFQDPDDAKKPPQYLANGSGDVICVSNFFDAVLDLPIDSPKDGVPRDDLNFEAWTERVPEKGTKVTVILEPVLEKK
jgi:hypothetical protein